MENAFKSKNQKLKSKMKSNSNEIKNFKGINLNSFFRQYGLIIKKKNLEFLETSKVRPISVAAFADSDDNDTVDTHVFHFLLKLNVACILSELIFGMRTFLKLN